MAIPIGIGSGDLAGLNPASKIKELNPNNILGSGGGSVQPDSGSGSFADTLLNSINKVNELQNTANNSAEAIATGQSSNIHQAMIDMEKANDSFELMMQVRNKIVTAYNTIMQMQV
jgi:flagellar hook-basal body complex protein FliE